MDEFSYKIFDEIVKANLNAVTQLGQSTRRVIVAGTTQVSNYISPNIFDVQGQLKRALEANRFSVIAVRMQANNWFGYENSVEVECNVGNQYSGEQQRQAVLAVMDSIVRSAGITNIKVFHNTQLQVTYDPGVTQTTQPPRQTSGGNTGGGNTGGGNTNYPTNFPTTQPPDVSPFAPGFATALGISTPIALAGAGLVLILLMKR